MTKKIVLTPEQRASILAGGTELEVTEPTIAPAPVAQTPAAAPAVQGPAAQSDAATTYLTGRLTDAETKLSTANAEITTLKATAAAGAPDAKVMEDLLAIARADVGRMQVALGNPDTSAALDAKTTITEHARVLPIFKEKLPVTQISKVTADAGTPEATALGTALAQRLGTA